MKNNTFIDFAFYIGFPNLIWVTSSAENIHLARRRNLGPKYKICTIEKVLFNNFYHLAKIRSID